MKRLIPFLVLFLAISCQNEEVEINNESEFLLKVKIENNSINRAPEESEFVYQLKLITYFSGRVLLKHGHVKNNILDFLHENNVIKYESLFNEIDGFKDAFIEESAGFNLFGRPGGHRPIPPITRNSRNNLINQNIPLMGRDLLLLTSEDLIEFILTNCLEMYLVKPLVLPHVNNSHLFITQHPLHEGQFLDNFFGFDLWQEETSSEEFANFGNYILFDEHLYNEQGKNVIVVRPNNEGECNYDFVYVENFREFYN